MGIEDVGGVGGVAAIVVGAVVALGVLVGVVIHRCRQQDAAHKREVAGLKAENSRTEAICTANLVSKDQIISAVTETAVVVGNQRDEFARGIDAANTRIILSVSAVATRRFEKAHSYGSISPPPTPIKSPVIDDGSSLDSSRAASAASFGRR